jgi:mono/diheme cytochrome c family protein
MKQVALFVLGFVVALSPAFAFAEQTEQAEAASDLEAEAFINRCSGCHTIGGGDMKGPDLLPATQWDDAALTTGIERMEEHTGPLATKDIATLVVFLKEADVRKRLEAERKRSVAQMAARLDAPNVGLGEALFDGDEALANDGLPCASCHVAGGLGGTMGPDLTDLGTRMQRVAMLSAIEKANFNVMRTSYRDHPVTKQEAVHLTAYVASLAGVKPAQQGSDAAWLTPVATGVALFILALIAFAYRGRGAAGVRARLVRDAQRS